MPTPLLLMMQSLIITPSRGKCDRLPTFRRGLDGNGESCEDAGVQIVCKGAEKGMQIPESYVNERVDHLGVGAGVYEERGLAAYLDRLAGETNRQVSVGTATVAMILNGLGFSNRRLYMALLSSIFLEMTAYELVLLSRFDLVRLNFTRFVAAQNIKRLLL